ncbi:MAG: amidoligase family protein [Polyangiaceae bacterium]
MVAPNEAPSAPVAYRLPPVLHTADGRVRRVGVEIELGGLDEQEAAAVVAEVYGGTVRQTGDYTLQVFDTSLGDFRVELDSHLLKHHHGRAFLDRIGVPRPVENALESVVGSVLRTFVPSEIVAPPVPVTDLHQLEALREALHRRHAVGTRQSLLYMFGFQMNPELPALDVDTLRRHLAAFLVLYEWLVEVSDVDITRRTMSFIDPFPEAYRRKLLAADYAPDLDGFVADYMEANPTRNRPLDMLPVLVTVRPELVMASALEPDQIKARPTFHYRLPNSLLDEPGWSFAVEWNRWVEVERLADDRPRLARLSAAYLAHADGGADRGAPRWAAVIGGEVRTAA